MSEGGKGAMEVPHAEGNRTGKDSQLRYPG